MLSFAALAEDSEKDGYSFPPPVVTPAMLEVSRKRSYSNYSYDGQPENVIQGYTHHNHPRYSEGNGGSGSQAISMRLNSTEPMDFNEDPQSTYSDSVGTIYRQPSNAHVVSSSPLVVDRALDRSCQGLLDLSMSCESSTHHQSCNSGSQRYDQGSIESDRIASSACGDFNDVDDRSDDNPNQPMLQSKITTRKQSLRPNIINSSKKNSKSHQCDSSPSPSSNYSNYSCESASPDAIL